MNIDALYKASCGYEPYAYQRTLAEQPWPDLLDIPTGLGKTAAVTIAWAFKRGWGSTTRTPCPDTPRRLVWCLPMRVLVEQTHEAICHWLVELGVYGEAGDIDKVAVHVLMGGEDGMRGWASHPEQDQIIIGTQDMLLSRALMRGYGMSRYQWAMDFALLHNDSLWVFDEIQLMGAGLAASAQLEAFRRDQPLARNSRSLWVSATLNKDWLDTIDLRPLLGALTRLSLAKADLDSPRIQKRLCAVKVLNKSTVAPQSSKKADVANYINQLSKELHVAHSSGGPTLVVLNTVDRAQQLAEAVMKLKPAYSVLVVHSRFRSTERAALNQALRTLTANDNTLIIATQAVEAGVDISVVRLYAELAPWSSLVQRFGRNNRGGEFDDAVVTWIDLADEKLALPYSTEQLNAAREKLVDLTSAASNELPTVNEARSAAPVLRHRDLIDLFDTDPDLSGFDIDVSIYIRDNDQPPPVQVFWRDIEHHPKQDAALPYRNELCPTSIAKIKEHLGKDKLCWQWDGVARKWSVVHVERVRPGMTLMLKIADGGYDDKLGFLARHNPKKTTLTELLPKVSSENAMGADPESQSHKAVTLEVHLQDTQLAACQLMQQLDQQEHANAITTAALWHDVGKAHSTFQTTLHGGVNGAPLLAKSPSRKNHGRRYFRHELASMLSWVSNGPTGSEHDLVAYLIAAHHGKVRMSIRSMPEEKPPSGKARRYARGIHEGDILPRVSTGELSVPETSLSLALMELGVSEYGESWTSRTQALLEHHGPFTLAWMETLVRIADWRASANPSCFLEISTLGSE